MAYKKTLSVALIALNEEENIGRTLESIKSIADEIVVIDTGSVDRTREIALSCGAKVYSEEWKGYAGTKNSAMNKCTCEWLLCLDCDEVVTKELADSISFAIQSNDYKGYFLSRKTVYLGKLLKYSWQPDKNLRLVNRESKPRWEGDFVHEFLTIEGNTTTLKGNLLHYSYKNVRHHFLKTIDYAKASAMSYYKAGKRFSLVNLLINPLIAFVRLYFFRRAFFDGVPGLVAGFSTLVYTFLKYVFLFELTMKGEKLED